MWIAVRWVVSSRRARVASLPGALCLVALQSLMGASVAHADPYVIQRGDSLTSIAQSFNTSVAALRSLNPRLHDSNTIRDGRVIEVPHSGADPAQDPATASSKAAPAATTTDSTSPVPATPLSANLGERPPAGFHSFDVAFPAPIESPLTHVVSKGDTLIAIARRHATSVADLVARNALSSPRLKVGTVLQVPNPPVYGRLPARLVERNERLALMGYFDRSAQAAGVDPALLKGLAFVESGWQPGMVSVDGAIGVTQLMPSTAAEVAMWRGDPTLDPHDPVDNIELGARYLRSLIDRFGGDTRLAVTAYYQGHQAVRTNGPSARGAAYAKAVLAARSKFLPMGPTSQP